MASRFALDLGLKKIIQFSKIQPADNDLILYFLEVANNTSLQLYNELKDSFSKEVNFLEKLIYNNSV